MDFLQGLHSLYKLLHIFLPVPLFLDRLVSTIISSTIATSVLHCLHLEGMTFFTSAALPESPSTVYLHLARISATRFAVSFLLCVTLGFGSLQSVSGFVQMYVGGLDRVFQVV